MEALGICLVTRSPELLDDVSFVVQQLNHGLAPLSGRRADGACRCREIVLHDRWGGA